MARVKQKLKEKSESSQKRESFTKLFASAQNLPAPAEKPSLSKLTSPSELQSSRTANHTVTSQERSSTKTLAASVPSPAPVTVTKRKRAPKAQGVSNGWFLLVPAIGLTTFVLLSPGEQSTDTKLSERPLAEYEKPEFREKVDFHRKTTGWKLNSERIGVDLDNRIDSTEIPVTAVPVPKDTIMKGLPLAGERNPRDIDVPPQMISPSHPDAAVQYQISREQQAIEFDRAARQEFIRELKANAAQAGYEVEVDTEGNARFTRMKRRPSSGNR